jgi:surface protein
MFYHSSFNSDISNWNTSNVKFIKSMFYHSQFNHDISNWNIDNVKDISSMFESSNITEIPKWDYFKIDKIKNVFLNCNQLTEKLPEWYQFNHINGEERINAWNKFLNIKKSNIEIYKSLSSDFKFYINKI